GFWGAGPTASEPALVLADESSGNVLWLGITAEHGQAAYHALRLRMESARISEVESYLGREGTPDLFAPVDSWQLDPAFSTPLTATADRAALVALVEGYFDSKQQNDGTLHTTLAADCSQVVNGVNLT